MDFDNIIKESIDRFLSESKVLFEQVDINQQIQQLMQQMQTTQDPNQKAQIMNQIQILQMQMQQNNSHMQQSKEQPNPAEAMGITPAAAGQAIGGEVLSRAAGHAVDYAGKIYDETKAKNALKLNKLSGVWHNSPKLRSGLKWGGAAAGVALGGYALLKMKKNKCKNKCYEQFTDQNQINNCLRLC